MASIFGAHVNGRGLLAHLDLVGDGVRGWVRDYGRAGDQDRDRDPGSSCSRCCYVLFTVCRVVLDERPAAVRIVVAPLPHLPPCHPLQRASPLLQHLSRKRPKRWRCMRLVTLRYPRFVSALLFCCFFCLLLLLL